jgi:hypothetical protein
VTGERRTREDQREPILGVGDVSNHTIDPGVGSRYEWLLNQSDTSIVEDPHAVVLVRRNDIDRIHAVRPCRPCRTLLSVPAGARRSSKHFDLSQDRAALPFCGQGLAIAGGDLVDTLIGVMLLASLVAQVL